MNPLNLYTAYILNVLLFGDVWHYNEVNSTDFVVSQPTIITPSLHHAALNETCYNAFSLQLEPMRNVFVHKVLRLIAQSYAVARTYNM